MFQFFLLFTFLTFWTGCSQESPKPQQQKTSSSPPVVAIPSFDGKQAFAYLTAQTDMGPRDPGSAGHENCLIYIQSEMKKYADEVKLQPFTITGYEGKELKLTNVIASFNPKATTRILFLTHWDSRPRADQDLDQKKRNQPIIAANDAASGVAILMEIGRHLKAKPTPIGVDLLFDDGEDYGKRTDDAMYLLGAKYFANNLPPGYKPIFGILLDMVGDAQLEIAKEKYSLQYAPDIVELVWSTARELGIYQFADHTQDWVLDDHIPLNDVGIKTIDLIDFDYPDGTNKYWHTFEDTPDKCSPQSLEAVGTVLMHVIYHQQPQ
jgi:glutaminyl-peptide cyclotransferase